MQATARERKGYFETFYYDYYDSTDPRTRDWVLVKYPIITVAVLASYLYFCTKAGPRLMKQRNPFELRKTLIAYNAFQVLLSTYIVYEAFASSWITDANYLCEPLDYSDRPSTRRMLQISYIYLVAKFTELMDTILFVLRKKSNQVTFLHVYHHCSMPFLIWIGVRYIPVGHVNLFGIINSFVHILMYSYYLITALGPQYYKYLWWKKYITLMQLVQFTVILIHNVIPFFIECSYPKSVHWIMICSCVLFLFLFGRFYINMYVRKPLDKYGKHKLKN